MAVWYRLILGTVAIGAGVVTIGLATSLTLPALVVLAVLGVAQLAHGVLTLTGRPAGYGIAVHALPTVVVAAIFGLHLLTIPSSLITTIAIGTGLNLLAVLLSGLGQRFRWPHRETRSTAVILLGALGAAALVGFTVTPALAATKAGESAPMHMGMDMGNMNGMNMPGMDMGH